MGVELCGGPADGELVDVREVRQAGPELAVLSYHSEGYYVLERGPQQVGVLRRASWVNDQDARFAVRRERRGRPRLGTP